jgi:putative transposase
MQEHLRVELVMDALEMATRRRDPGPGLIHSDRGVQYCCGEYRAQLQRWGMVASMNRAGDCYDNAAMESFWATLKNEVLGGKAFTTKAQARAALFDYIEVFYNRERIHSSLGYVSPETFEADRR